ncbi:hypothetical protein IAR50_005426 [Cryptococcus sp. DSM 104548]
MSANPPILAVPHQRSSPQAHIQRYLSSVEPYINEHARTGVCTFEKALRGEPPPQIEAGGTLNLFGEEGEELVTRAELLARLGGSRGGGVKPAEPAKRQPLKDIQTASFKLTLESLANSRENAKAKAEKKNQKGTKPKEDVFDQSETENAQRRLERKHRRREKAAITKPKQCTPPPAKRMRKAKPPSVDGSLEGSETSDEVDARIRCRRKQATPSFVRKYQAKNVQAAVLRISAKPVKKQGFLNHGKASLPIRLPPEKARVAAVRPFSEDAFLGSQSAPRQPPDEEDTFQWKLPHNRALSSHPSTDVDNPLAQLTSHLRSPARAPSHLSLPSSIGQQRPPSAQSSYSRMPPPGIANSPSWHTEITEEQMSLAPKASMERMAHGTPRVTATPGPSRITARTMAPPLTHISPALIPRAVTPPIQKAEQPSPRVLQEALGGEGFVWPKNRGMGMSFGQAAYDDTTDFQERFPLVSQPRHPGYHFIPNTYRPPSTLPESSSMPIFGHTAPLHPVVPMENEYNWRDQASRDDERYQHSEYEVYGEDWEYQEGHHHEPWAHRSTLATLHQQEPTFVPSSPQTHNPDQLAPSHHRQDPYHHQYSPQPSIFIAPDATRRERPQTMPPTVNNTFDQQLFSVEASVPRMYESPSLQRYARGYAMSRRLDEGRDMSSWTEGRLGGIENTSGRDQVVRSSFDGEDNNGELGVTEEQWKSIWSGGAGLR